MPLLGRATLNRYVSQFTPNMMQEYRYSENNTPIEHELEYCEDDRCCWCGTLQDRWLGYYPDRNGEQMRYHPPESSKETKVHNRIPTKPHSQPPKQEANARIEQPKVGGISQCA
jgi:hypothetical protein